MATVFIHDRFTASGKTSHTRTIFTSSYLEGLFRDDQRKLLKLKTTGPCCSRHAGLSLFHPFPKENLTNAPHSACKTHVCVPIFTTTYTCCIYTREMSTGPALRSTDHVARGAAARREVSDRERRRCQECLQGREGAAGRGPNPKTMQKHNGC